MLTLKPKTCGFSCDTVTLFSHNFFLFMHLTAALAESVGDIFKKCRKHVLMVFSVCSESGGEYASSVGLSVRMFVCTKASASCSR